MDSEEKYNILYVDDEPDNLLVFRSAFRRHYNVVTATSANEALELLKEQHFAIVLTDQRMPNISGIDFLVSLPDDQDAIRMILTGYSDVSVVIDAINSGKVYRYITKPWDKDELKITLDTALESYTLRKRNKELISELQQANQFLEQKVEERTLEVNRQKQEVEKLLLNILPAETAEELKKYGKAIARRYEMATVLFSDIEGFTKIAEVMAPEDLVAELDTCFRAFDDIVTRHGLEKIKTIGDAYMCAGGIPVPAEDNAHRVIKAALEMQQFMHGYRLQSSLNGTPKFQLRIGIHTGPVVAGVVGNKKFAYDIWGDTVNTAARMEQNGEAGKVNISEATLNLVKDSYTFKERGLIQVKNKGELNMYFVESLLEEAVSI